MTAPAEFFGRARKVRQEIAFLAAKDVSQKSAPPFAQIVAKRGDRLPWETFDLIKLDGKGRPSGDAGKWRCERRPPAWEAAK
jgi:hypothetical protein